VLGKRDLPANRRIRPPEDAEPESVAADESEPKAKEKAKAKRVKPRGPSRLRMAAAKVRGKLAGLRAAAGIVFVVAASIALAWGIKQHVVTSPRFAVKNIRVEGTVKRTPEQVAEAAGLAIGMNVFSLDLVNARRRLLQDPWIANAEVERKLPSTLTITVTEREAAAVVAVDSDLYLCTHEGELFKKLEADDPIGLIVINGLTASLVANDRKLAVERIRSALDLLASYQSNGPSAQHPAQEVYIDDDGSLRMTVGKSVMTLEMGKGPYRRKVIQAAQVLREAQKYKADPAIVFLDNEAHPERVVVRMR